MSEDTQQRQQGRFEGDRAVRLLPDGRRVQLINAVAYFDPAGLEWFVPADAIVDGASIPRALWSFIGGPFEGRYRDASIIHDWYCDRRNRPWRAVHRVFYDAMVTSGVSPLQAKAMYGAVFAGGPRWSDTVVQNNRLDHPRTRTGVFGRPAEPRPTPASEAEPTANIDVSSVRQLISTIEAADPSLDEIDALVETGGYRPE